MPRASRCRSFNFYPDEFLNDQNVVVMNSEEVGVYVKLIMAAWQQDIPGVLPAQDEALMRLARASLEEWHRCKAAVARCFDTSDGRWVQKRLRREYEAQSQRFERIRGVRRGAVRQRKWRPVGGIESNGQSNDQSNVNPPSLLHSFTPSSPLPTLPLKTNIRSSAARTVRVRKEEHPAFPAWYAAYPRRASRGAARRAYSVAVQKATPEELLAGAARYAKWLASTGTPLDKTKHPATWLNQECWLDEYNAGDRTGSVFEMYSVGGS